MKNSIKSKLIYQIIHTVCSNGWITFVISVVTICLCWLVFNLPLWLFLLIYIAEIILLSTGVVYVSMTSIFTEEGQLKAIPENKFVEITKELELDARKVKELGFEQVGSFYREAIGKQINYTFKHPQENIYWSLNYIFSGYKKTFVSAVFTQFNSNLHLETISLQSIKNFVPPRFYFQMIGSIDVNILLNKHKKALECFIERGHTPVEIKIDNSHNYHNYFTEIYQEVSKYAMKDNFWVLKMLFPMSKTNKKYLQTIQEQLEKRLIHIPVI